MGTFYDLRKLIEEYPYTAKQYLEAVFFNKEFPKELDECKAIQQQIEDEDNIFLSRNICPLCGVDYNVNNQHVKGGGHERCDASTGYNTISVCQKVHEPTYVRFIRFLLTGETAKQRAWRVYAPMILGGRK